MRSRSTARPSGSSPSAFGSARSRAAFGRFWTLLASRQSAFGFSVVELSSGVELAFPPALAEGLAGASDEDLATIEVSASGLGLHWPRLDADLYVPALLQGILGSPRWMAAQLGAAGG